MNQILEQLYIFLNQEKEALSDRAVEVADLSRGQNHEAHIEKLIDYNLQKGRTNSVEDVIRHIEKVMSITNTLKAI
ncbi:hypothetical protein [Enterococcus faecalis]|uniref:hypothetical protein n=1 Tax=Enterococcus faecalis TaxID=1351 RepID=UPI002FDBE35F